MATDEIVEYVEITDPHFTAVSNVRPGDYIDDLIRKLVYVRKHTNEWGATLIIAGDVFDKPTVADFVKTRVIKELRKFDKKPLVIYGNHDTLFNNREKDEKTSLQLLIEAGVVDKLTYIDKGTHILTNMPVMKEEGKPQIGVYHGFLNQEDGLNTFRFDQINHDDNAIVILGHDHVQYEPVEYRNTVIHRIGAFVRGIRNDSEIRIPQMMRIRVREGKIFTKLYNIECKAPELVFKEKKAKAVKIEHSYEDIINQIKLISGADMPLDKALSLVTTDNTRLYIKSVLDDVNNLRESK